MFAYIAFTKISDTASVAIACYQPRVCLVLHRAKQIFNLHEVLRIRLGSLSSLLNGLDGISFALCSRCLFYLGLLSISSLLRRIILLLECHHTLALDALWDILGVFGDHVIPRFLIVRGQVGFLQAPVVAAELISAYEVFRRGEGVGRTKILLLTKHDFVSEERSPAELVLGANLVIGAEFVLEPKLLL